MAAPVNCDTAIPALYKKQHLTIPGVGVQRPTVRERYDWATAPVLVVDLCAVFCGNRAHESLLKILGFWTSKHGSDHLRNDECVRAIGDRAAVTSCSVWFEWSPWECRVELSTSFTQLSRRVASCRMIRASGDTTRPSDRHPPGIFGRGPVPRPVECGRDHEAPTRSTFGRA